MEYKSSYKAIFLFFLGLIIPINYTASLWNKDLSQHISSELFTANKNLKELQDTATLFGKLIDQSTDIVLNSGISAAESALRKIKELARQLQQEETPTKNNIAAALSSTLQHSIQLFQLSLKGIQALTDASQPQQAYLKESYAALLAQIDGIVSDISTFGSQMAQGITQHAQTTLKDISNRFESAKGIAKRIADWVQAQVKKFQAEKVTHPMSELQTENMRIKQIDQTLEQIESFLEIIRQNFDRRPHGSMP